MGRKGIRWECIPGEKKRQLAFRQRSVSIKNKVKELCSKCGVEACLIIYEGESDGCGGRQQPLIWPEERPAEVRSIIQKYEAEKKNVRPPENYDLRDFFENRKNAVEGDISKARKEILEFKYPTFDPIFKSLDEEHLMKFIAALDAKIGACNQQLDMLKKNITQRIEKTNLDFVQQNNMDQSESFDAFFSNPSQLNYSMQSFSQMQHQQQQLIPTPMNMMMPLDHNSQLYFLDHDDMGSQNSQMPHDHFGPQVPPHLDPNLMQLMMGNNNEMADATYQVGEEPMMQLMMGNNNEMVDATYQVEEEPMMQLMMAAKDNVMVDSKIEEVPPHLDPNLMQLMMGNNNNNNEMVDATYQVGGEPMMQLMMAAEDNVMVDSKVEEVPPPLDSTKVQNGGAVIDSTDHLGEPLDWVSQYAKAAEWASDFDELM